MKIKLIVYRESKIEIVRFDSRTVTASWAQENKLPLTPVVQIVKIFFRGFALSTKARQKPAFIKLRTKAVHYSGSKTEGSKTVFDRCY